MYIYSDQPLAHLSYTFSVKPETCFPLQVAPILGRWKKTPRSPKLFVCIFWVFLMCFCHGKSPWNDDIKTTIWENMCGMFFPFRIVACCKSKMLVEYLSPKWFFFGIRIGEFWFLYETKAKKIHVGEYHPILVPEVFTKRGSLYLQLYNHLKWKKYLGRFFPLRLGSNYDYNPGATGWNQAEIDVFCWASRLQQSTWQPPQVPWSPQKLV